MKRLIITVTIAMFVLTGFCQYRRSRGSSNVNHSTPNVSHNNGNHGNAVPTQNVQFESVATIPVTTTAERPSQEPETIKMRGKGIGVDKMEALKDAYRDAIERAVGVYVDAEQMVKNEELVKDQILTQSNAYIEKYQIVMEGKSPNGLVSVTILADVRKRELAKKIKDVMPSNKVVLTDVSKDLHAQIVTDMKAKEDALAIIKNELKDLHPVKQLMKVALATTKPVVESVTEDPSLVRLWYPVRVCVDVNKYYKEFAPRWSRILEQIKVAPAKRLDLKNNLVYMKAYNNYIIKTYGMARNSKMGVMTRCDMKRGHKHFLQVRGSDPLACDGLALNEEYQGMAFLQTMIIGKDYVLHGFGRERMYIDGFSGTEFVNKERYHRYFIYVAKY